MNSPIPKSDNSSITEEETTIYNYKDDPENPLVYDALILMIPFTHCFTTRIGQKEKSTVAFLLCF